MNKDYLVIGLIITFLCSVLFLELYFDQTAPQCPIYDRIKQ